MTDTSFVALAIRLVLSLGLVLAIMLAAAAVVKRRGLGRLGRGGVMEVVSRQSLNRGSSLAVVRVGDRHLILGVTEHSVTLIDEADGRLFAPAAAIEETTGGQRTALPGEDVSSRRPPAWTALIDALRDRTLRRT